MTWGGKREGAGRKPKDEVRKARTLRAYDDEWQLHLALDKIIKYGNKQAAIDFIESHRVIKD